MDTITREYSTLTAASGPIRLDRNIGAAQKANSSNDAAAYGHYFTWTAINETGQFAGAGPGKICPEGFRLPNAAELLAELPALTASSACAENALNNLSLPLAGYRSMNSGDSSAEGGRYSAIRSYVWSRSSTTISDAARLSFTNSTAGISSDNKLYGYSVRCIQE